MLLPFLLFRYLYFLFKNTPKLPDSNNTVTGTPSDESSAHLPRNPPTTPLSPELHKVPLALDSLVFSSHENESEEEDALSYTSEPVSQALSVPNSPLGSPPPTGTFSPPQGRPSEVPLPTEVQLPPESTSSRSRSQRSSRRSAMNNNITIDSDKLNDTLSRLIHVLEAQSQGA